MKPSELAIKLEGLLSRFEEEWDPEDVKSIAEFIIEYGGSFAVALRHHEALVKALRGVINGKCTFQGAEQLLATIEREAL